MLTVYDETMVKSMSKDELRAALENVQKLACAQEEMIERQGEALMSYKCLLDDLYCINNFRNYVDDVKDHTNKHGALIDRKYAKEGMGVPCCAEAPCNEPS